MPGIHRSLRPLLVTAVVVLCAATLLAPPGPHGEARAVGLSLGVPTPATFASPLGPSGSVDTTGGAVTVTALAGWELRVRGTDGGRLRSAGAGSCASGSTLLTNPLRFWAGGSGVSSPGSSAGPLVLSGSSQVLASGSVGGLVALAVPVTVTYRYVPSASDQLPATCPYTLTATIDLSA